MGQNTGISKTEKNVMMIHVPVPLVHANQNLNSGSLLANGRNSFPSRAVVGSDGPESSVGSSSGERKAMKLFNRKIPSPYATMKYPWTRKTRRKNKNNKNTKNSHRGTTWIVDLSNQYCTARLTMNENKAETARKAKKSGQRTSLVQLHRSCNGDHNDVKSIRLNANNCWSTESEHNISSILLFKATSTRLLQVSTPTQPQILHDRYYYFHVLLF